jgi:hypothetical protein
MTIATIATFGQPEPDFNPIDLLSGEDSRSAASGGNMGSVLEGSLLPGEVDQNNFTLATGFWACRVAGIGGDIDIYVYNGLGELILKDDASDNMPMVSFMAHVSGAKCTIRSKTNGSRTSTYYGKLY